MSIWDSGGWQNEFNGLEDFLGCDRITIRVCGDRLDDIKSNSEPQTGHRVLLAYHGYAYPQEDLEYAGPLSLLNDDESWYRSDEIIIVEDLTQQNNSLSETQFNLLKALNFQSWIGFGLHYQDRLVGLVTIDYITSPVQAEKVSEIRDLLKAKAALWAEIIHKGYEQRKQKVQEEVAQIVDKYYQLSKIFEEFTSTLVTSIDQNRLLVNSCEIFREETKNSKKMKRWYPEQPERVLDEESVASKSKEHARINYDIKNGIKTTDRLRSILAVPIKTTNKDLIAVITVSSIKPNVFCWYDVELVLEAIKVASIAIERGWVIDSLHQFIMQGLCETDKDTIVKKIFNTLKDLIGFEEGFITLVSDNVILSEDTKQREIQIIYCYPDDDNTKELNGIPEKLIDTITKNEIVEDPQFKGMQYAIGIKHEEYLLGILFWKSQNKDGILLEMLTRFTQYLGVALYHQYMYDLQQRFDEACIRVLECFTFSDTLKMIAKMARELTDATASYVLLVEPNRVDLRVVATSFAKDYYADFPSDMNLDGSGDGRTGLTGNTINTRKTSVLNNISEQRSHRQYRQFYIPVQLYKNEEKVEPKSEIAVAMLLRDQNRNCVAGIPALGAINLQHMSEEHFREFHKRLIEKFALFVATVIQRYNFPAHPYFNIDYDPTKDADIFFALKFSPETRRRSLEKWVIEATELASKNELESKNEESEFVHVRQLTVRSADISGTIGSGIWTYIARCEILIADMSGDSKNVFYEIGLAHALNKPVILICDENTKPPVDLQGINYIEYDYYDKTNDRFIQNLAREIRKLAVQNPKIHQVVHPRVSKDNQTNSQK